MEGELQNCCFTQKLSNFLRFRWLNVVVTNYFTNGKVDGIFESLAILDGLESNEI